MPLTISRIGHSRGRPVAHGFGNCSVITSFSVGQIGLVLGNGMAMLLSSGWRPHGELKVGSRTLESPRGMT